MTLKTFREKIKVIRNKLYDKSSDEDIGAKELAAIFSAPEGKKKDKQTDKNEIYSQNSTNSE